MKKVLAIVMLVVVMTLSLGTTAFADGGPLSLNQAKQTALDYAGVNASEAIFTKAHRDWDDGREVYEIEFYVGHTEYDMDVDVNTGRVTDFSVELHGGYGRDEGRRVDRDWDDDWDDRYDDDRFDWD